MPFSFTVLICLFIRSLAFLFPFVASSADLISFLLFSASLFVKLWILVFPILLISSDKYEISGNVN
jgi:hypothetical protein